MSRVCCILFLFLILGCQQKQRSETKTGEFSITDINITEPVSFEKLDLFDSVQFVKLEARDSSFLGHVTKLRVYKDRIYVLDRRYAKALFIFTKNGRYLKTIKNEGRGPKEFVSIFNFDIDYNKDELIIMDNYGYKFGFFDLEGNYLRETHSKIDILNAVVLPGGYIVHAKTDKDFWKMGKPDGCDRIFYTTEKGKIIKSAFPYKDNDKFNIFNNNVLNAKADGDILFAPRFRDTIYTLTFNEITPKFALNFPDGAKIPKEVLQKATEGEIDNLCAQGKWCFIGTFIETDSYLYLNINFWGNAFPAFYSKKTGKVISVKLPDGFNPADPLYAPLANEDDYFWSALDYVKIEHFEYDKIPFHIDTLNITEDDNPWLIRYKLKEF